MAVEQPARPAAAVVREFRAPYSTETLRILQGRACIRCKTMRGELYPAGRAVSIGPNGERIPWDVRQCATCQKASS